MSTGLNLQDPSEAADRNATDAAPIQLDGGRLQGRTFLLGNQGGIVFYQPVAQNVPDATLQATKWFGVSGFGSSYIEDNLVWLVRDERGTKLDRTCQIAFTQELDRATRTFEVDGCIVRQTFFVPDRVDALAMVLEVEGDGELRLQPELDMRYYQAFNSSFDGYHAEIVARGGHDIVRVTNRIATPSETHPHLDLFVLFGVFGENTHVSMLPEGDRLRHKVYLKDELRMRLIEHVYVETQERSPDEAPIWDQYETYAYAPAEIRGTSPLTVLYAVGGHPGEALEAFDAVLTRLPDLARRKRVASRERLRLGAVKTGRPDVDRAYAHVLTRFNDCLVARDVKFHGAGGEQPHFNAIFAGNKYFLDAWKRDENVSLIGPLATGDFETVRVILADTWHHQDPRTGRLPHILRVGEPLVYYSSDGTLWALERLHRYTRMSGDRTLLDEKYQMVEQFFTASLGFVKRGLLPSGGIIDKSYLWETWMDTAYTPRDGYPVEIELLWLTVLERFVPFVDERNPALASRLRAALEEGRDTFALFYLDGYLADSLSYAWEPRDLLTPNGHIAFGLNFPLPANLGRHMVMLGREQLAGRVGIRSLAPRDWARVFPPEFMQDPDNIRGDNMVSVGIYNYHRGIEWLWLNQFFVAGELRYGDAETAYRIYLQGQVHAALNESGVGGLGELHDAHGPLGADFQAWSMAGFVASLHEFIGVEVDATARRLRVLPSTPDEWTEIDARCRVGDTHFEVHCRADGASRLIEIIPDTDALDGYSLEVGVRVCTNPAGVQLELRGSPVPKERLRIDRDGQEIWIDTQISGKTVMTFRGMQ